MASTSKLPPHRIEEHNNERAIELFDWRISAVTSTISNATHLNHLQSSLGLPLPEMTFGHNCLSLTHKPSGWSYRFDAHDALKCVRNGELQTGDGGVKVNYAEAWAKTRTDPLTRQPLQAAVQKPFDWTYTTTYSGHSTSAISWAAGDSAAPSHCIPLAELSRPDPIMFYAEIPLFEDELHDNGSSHLLVRIRVMPTCFFILSRFTLRVDDVLFRMRDTRIYHSFSSRLVVKEATGWEAPYNRVKLLLPRRDDLSPLTDPNFISKALTGFPEQVSQCDGAGTSWAGLGSHLEISQLEVG